MRTMLCNIIILLLLQSFAFGAKEDEVVYQGTKLDLSTEYNNNGYSTLTERTSQELSVRTWFITKDGEKMSEYDFFKTIGMKEKANQVWIGQCLGRTSAILSCVLFGEGLFFAFYPYGEEVGARGAALALGALAFYFLNPWKVKEHYMSYGEARNEIDIYNAKLRSGLGIIEK